MFRYFKTVVVILKFISSLVVLRNYAKIIYDISNKYGGVLPISKLRKLEKLSLKVNKANLDINFLLNCRKLGVIPKFLFFNLPYTNNNDAKAFRKRLLRSALRKRNHEKLKLDKELNNLKSKIRNIINGIKWYLLIQAIQKTVKHRNIQIAKTYEKKLSNLTHNKVLPFTPDDVITNLSSYKISHEEANILKYGLGNSIPPERLSRTDVFVNFDLIHRYVTEELESRHDGSSLRSNLSHLANSYYSNYKPTRAALKKHGILKKLRNNKDIVILRPDKGNGVVIIDKITYKSKMYELLNDESKFKQLTSDPTKLCEGQLQRYLRKLNNKGYFDESIYDYIYPAGSLPSRLYGTPKIHKIKEKSDIPPLRPIVSSINSYNYNLASYLCALLTPFIPAAYCKKDSFIFIKDIQKVRKIRLWFHTMFAVFLPIYP